MLKSQWDVMIQRSSRKNIRLNLISFLFAHRCSQSEQSLPSQSFIFCLFCLICRSTRVPLLLRTNSSCKETPRPPEQTHVQKQRQAFCIDLNNLTLQSHVFLKTRWAEYHYFRRSDFKLKEAERWICCPIICQIWSHTFFIQTCECARHSEVTAHLIELLIPLYVIDWGRDYSEYTHQQEAAMGASANNNHHKTFNQMKKYI